MAKKKAKSTGKWEEIERETAHNGKTYVLLRSTDGKDRYVIRPAEGKK